MSNPNFENSCIPPGCSVLQQRDRKIVRPHLSTHYDVKETTRYFQKFEWISPMYLPSKVPKQPKTLTQPLYRNPDSLPTPCSYDSWWGEEQDNCDGYLDLPGDFVPPKHCFARGPNRDETPIAANKITATPLPEPFVHLRNHYVVCGRGAPTMTQPGNQAYRELISEHETAYLCAKRTDKPVIATKVMKILQSKDVCFVRRERHPKLGLGWVKLDESKIYEKVCQSLREGAPELRRKVLAADAYKSIKSTRQKTEARHDQENCYPGAFCV